MAHKPSSSFGGDVGFRESGGNFTYDPGAGNDLAYYGITGTKELPSFEGPESKQVAEFNFYGGASFANYLPSHAVV